MLDVVLLIGWLTLFDKRIGVPDTGDWFDEPPNKEDEEELVPIFRTISKNETYFIKFKEISFKGCSNIYFKKSRDLTISLVKVM